MVLSLLHRLSGLSPFLGETDAETMNFIVNCSWDFDADTFKGLSEEAKDFVSRLLVKEKRYFYLLVIQWPL
jgi:myosin-light-chain kinase